MIPCDRVEDFDSPFEVEKSEPFKLPSFFKELCTSVENTPKASGNNTSKSSSSAIESDIEFLKKVYSPIRASKIEEKRTKTSALLLAKNAYENSIQEEIEKAKDQASGKLLDVYKEKSYESSSSRESMLSQELTDKFAKHSFCNHCSSNTCCCDGNNHNDQAQTPETGKISLNERPSSSDPHTSNDSRPVCDFDNSFVIQEQFAESYKQHILNDTKILQYSISGKVVETLSELLQLFNCTTLSEEGGHLQVLHQTTGSVIKIAKSLFSNWQYLMNTTIPSKDSRDLEEKSLIKQNHQNNKGKSLNSQFS